MNKRQLMEQRREVLNKVRISNRVINKMREYTNNDFIHEDMKWKVYWYLRKQGHSVITEAIFENGSGRADILDLDTGMVVEVLYNETEEECKEKTKDYPIEDIIMVDAEKEFIGEDVF